MPSLMHIRHRANFRRETTNSGGNKMKKNMAVMLAVLGLITLGLFAFPGCTSTGADVYLEGVSIGSVTVEGKPVTGLPSQTVNVVLKVDAKQVNISTSGGQTTIKLSPSNASIVVGPNGTSFTGVKPEQVQIQWPSTQ
jgi:hypothetical protein